MSGVSLVDLTPTAGAEVLSSTGEIDPLSSLPAPLAWPSSKGRGPAWPPSAGCVPVTPAGDPGELLSMSRSVQCWPARFRYLYRPHSEAKTVLATSGKIAVALQSLCTASSNLGDQLHAQRTAHGQLAHLPKLSELSAPRQHCHPNHAAVHRGLWTTSTLIHHTRRWGAVGTSSAARAGAPANQTVLPTVTVLPSTHSWRSTLYMWPGPDAKP